MSLESRLQEASQEFQKLQIDLTKVVEARQQLDAQLSENESVKKVVKCGNIIKRNLTFYYFNNQEFEQLMPENTIYKLIGPILVQQDQAEAKSNVDTRLAFIQNEMFEFSSIINSTRSFIPHI